MKDADEGNISVSIFRLNVGAGVFAIMLGLLLLYGTFFETLDVTPGRFGASPRDLPFVCAVVSLVSGAMLLVDVWKSRHIYKPTYVAIGTKGQPLALLRCAIIFALVPAFVKAAGFYVTILTTQIIQMSFAQVRNWRVLFISALLVAAIIYFLLQLLCRCDLPKGVLYDLVIGG